MPACITFLLSTFSTNLQHASSPSSGHIRLSHRKCMLTTRLSPISIPMTQLLPASRVILQKLPLASAQDLFVSMLTGYIQDQAVHHLSRYLPLFVVCITNKSLRLGPSPSTSILLVVHSGSSLCFLGARALNDPFAQWALALRVAVTRPE